MLVDNGRLDRGFPEHTDALIVSRYEPFEKAHPALEAERR